MPTIRCQNRIFSNIAAVVFDKDGTLADSHAYLRTLGMRRSRLIDAKIPGVGEPLLMAFGVRENGLNPAGMMAVGSRRDNEIAAAAYVAETGRDWMEALSIAQEAFAEADRNLQPKAPQTPIFPGSLELLRSLRSAKLKLAILSADTTANVQEFVQHYALDVDAAIGTDDNLGKPNPQFLERAGAAIDVPCAQMLVVGDSIADIELARSAGAAGAIGVTWGWTSIQQLAGADVVIDQFDQIEVIA
ncbi:HAD family hydrolase [Microcoleus sp. FACHB-1515]|uniref:HAD family hydrolase n=1 Tax=Cyanophyceae TaxID=3028117 RepID=UPI001686F075|nr:HAD family hydrolase [Microcoleus sp. FACHB-1515]MBD2092248.1 HAD family hydrolase [Microcoleus sp. FACHB-1515]